MLPSQQASEGRPQALHQVPAGYAGTNKAPLSNYSQAYPLLSQPLQPQPAHQMQMPQLQGLPTASTAHVLQPALQDSAPATASYQSDGMPSAWQTSAAQQPHQALQAQHAPAQLAHPVAPQSVYAQQQQQQYPGLHQTHAPAQHAVAVHEQSPAHLVPSPQQVPSSLIPFAAPSAARHVQAAAGTSAASSGRGFTHNQLNVLRNQILAFRRIKVGRVSTSMSAVTSQSLCCW